MDAGYAEALTYLNSLVDFEKLGATYFGRDRFQLSTVRRLLAELGDPQAGLQIVHIAGTKGKGSTAAMLDAILRAAGRRVGLFTQPHLVDMRERTRVFGRMLTRAEFAEAIARARPVVDGLNAEPGGEAVTFYEAHLAAALVAFAAVGVEIALMETGLGGRLDATNALTPVATAITRIDYDHTDILGERLEDIAREKAGILKPAVPCVFAPQPPEAAEVLLSQAAAVGAPVRELPRVRDQGDGSFDIRAAGVYRGLRLPLAGRHQRENAAVAVALAEMLADLGHEIPETAVRTGLAAVTWPGRFQLLPGRPTAVLDVAHNRVSAEVLREGLRDLLAAGPGRKALLVVGIAKDKDVPGFVEALAPVAAQMICTRAGSPRAAEPAAIEAAALACGLPTVCVPTVPEAVRHAVQVAGDRDVVCVTGSFHVVGEAMQTLGVRPFADGEG